MNSRLRFLRRLAFSVSLLLIAYGAAQGGGWAHAAAAVSAAEDASRPFIVKIHADWCGTCNMLNGTFEALDEKFGDRVRIVILDVTDREALERSVAEVERLGIGPFFDRFKRWTGTVGVLDGADRSIVSVIQGDLRTSVYEEAVAKATRSASS